ncbi:alpha/beta hydrolase [Luteolibacter algae]|uniref:Alpha/beta hydrolase n=2 Tax=Luteolibacter algae TaxID=454151 RepID=A0ABW5D8N5_9BACT
MKFPHTMNDGKTPASDSSAFPWKRLMARMAVWFLLAVVIFFGVIVWWCANEVAQPGRRPIHAGASAFFDGTAKAGYSVETFTSSQGVPALLCTPEVVGVFSPRAGLIRQQLGERGVEIPASGKIVGTIVILHGRGGMKEDYLAVAERFCAVGFRCLILDLPGHGGNPGKFTTYGVLEAPMVLECYQEAAGEYGFSGDPCMLFGQSMGGSVAVYTAALPESPFRSMVVVSSFDSLRTVIGKKTDSLLGLALGGLVEATANHVYGWRTGVKFSEIRPCDEAAKIHIPSLLVHGDDDNFVTAESGKLLFDALPDEDKKQWLIIPGGNHNNVLITDYPLYSTIAEWFLESAMDDTVSKKTRLPDLMPQ